jgi:hypothetical protein
MVPGFRKKLFICAFFPILLNGASIMGGMFQQEGSGIGYAF